MNSDKVNVLIVDDLREKILVHRTILDELGENLIAAGSGAEALKLVLQHDFAVILLDVNMPGMDGLEAAELIRQRKKSAHTPIIFVTAYADDVRTSQGYAHGAVDYILTPIVPEILRAKVKVFVDLFRMTQQVKRQAEERIALADERTKRTAAEEANRNLRFLTQAGALLGQSLDYDSIVNDLVRLVVPTLADFAAVVHAEHRAETEAIAAVRMGPDGPIFGRSSQRETLSERMQLAISQVLASGQSLVTAKDNDDADSLAGIVLPLKSRARTSAALVLTRHGRGRDFAPADVSLAEAIASRAAAALDNAGLYREIQQADHQKNEFLSMLAHELRNPLAPIRNAVELLRLRGLDPSGIEWARDVIDRQVVQLVRLVDDLLDISRITRGKIQLQVRTVEVSEVISLALEASRPLFDARKHRLEVSLPQMPLWVQGDSVRIAQILTNLLNNAAKYTLEGGLVSLSVGLEGENVLFRVRDSGIGIPGEMLSAIFDLFTQVDRSIERSEGGLGIGLTLVRRLVEMHGGSVTAASDGPGKGSEFTVRLAAAAPIQRGVAIPDSQNARKPGPGQRVLVVDDNIDGADSLATLLRLRGHDVVIAHDGLRAVELANDYCPDVVLLDIGLPGMDGFEVAKRLRASFADVKLVAVTGYGRDEDRQRSMESGFNHHLVKPINLDALHDVVQAPMADRKCDRLPVCQD